MLDLSPLSRNSLRLSLKCERAEGNVALIGYYMAQPMQRVSHSGLVLNTFEQPQTLFRMDTRGCEVADSLSQRCGAQVALWRCLACLPIPETVFARLQHTSARRPRRACNLRSGCMAKRPRAESSVSSSFRSPPAPDEPSAPSIQIVASIPKIAEGRCQAQAHLGMNSGCRELSNDHSSAMPASCSASIRSNQSFCSTRRSSGSARSANCKKKSR